jgi:hypothetical protein
MRIEQNNGGKTDEPEYKMNKMSEQMDNETIIAQERDAIDQ